MAQRTQRTLRDSAAGLFQAGPATDLRVLPGGDSDDATAARGTRGS